MEPLLTNAFPTMAILTSNDVEIAIKSNPNTKASVHRIQSYYQTINVTETMTKLIEVGQLLQLAHSVSKGYAHSPKIMQIIIQYQFLINNSATIASSFVETAIKAFNAFKRVLTTVEEKNDIPLALTTIYRTANLADSMEKLCGEVEIVQRNSKDNFFYFVEKRSKETDINSIKSLEIVISCFGKLTTVFENICLLSINLKRQCKTLANCEDIENGSTLANLGQEFKIDFINSIKSQGLTWLALADINRQTAISMQQLKGNIDKIIYDHLPISGNAIQLIKNLSDEL